MRYKVIATFIIDEDDEDGPTKSDVYKSFDTSFGPVGIRRAVGGWNSTLTDLTIETARESTDENGKR
jgi:hypothetical protein